jgi:hypothetical protein
MRVAEFSVACVRKQHAMAATFALQNRHLPSYCQNVTYVMQDVGKPTSIVEGASTTMTVLEVVTQICRAAGSGARRSTALP